MSSKNSGPQLLPEFFTGDPTNLDPPTKTGCVLLNHCYPFIPVAFYGPKKTSLPFLATGQQVNPCDLHQGLHSAAAAWWSLTSLASSETKPVLYWKLIEGMDFCSQDLTARHEFIKESDGRNGWFLFCSIYLFCVVELYSLTWRCIRCNRSILTAGINCSCNKFLIFWGCI